MSREDAIKGYERAVRENREAINARYGVGVALEKARCIEEDTDTELSRAERTLKAALLAAPPEPDKEDDTTTTTTTTTLTTASIDALSLGPRDVLVIHTEALLSMDQRQDLRRQVEGMLASAGLANKAMVIAPGLRLEVLRVECDYRGDVYDKIREALRDNRDGVRDKIREVLS